MLSHCTMYKMKMFFIFSMHKKSKLFFFFIILYFVLCLYVFTKHSLKHSFPPLNFASGRWCFKKVVQRMMDSPPADHKLFLLLIGQINILADVLFFPLWRAKLLQHLCGSQTWHRQKPQIETLQFRNKLVLKSQVLQTILINNYIFAYHFVIV